MKLKLLCIASVWLMAGCSTPASLITQALKPDTGITAQVGAENVKQGVGVTSKVDTSRKTSHEQRDISGQAKVDNTVQDKGAVSVKDAQTAVVNASKDAQSIGPVVAEKVVVSNGSPWPVVVFALVVVALLLVFGWLLLRKRSQQITQGTNTLKEEPDNGE